MDRWLVATSQLEATAALEWSDLQVILAICRAGLTAWFPQVTNRMLYAASKELAANVSREDLLEVHPSLLS